MRVSLTPQFPATTHPHTIKTPNTQSYTQVEVSAATKDDFKAWDGWVHSRMRTLVARVEDFVDAR